MRKLKSKFVGSLIGTGIGDWLGNRGKRYSDDTAMMIGVAESLIESMGFDGENMAKRFVENYYKEPWRGYGFGPPRIFEMIKSGRKWNEQLDREIYPPHGSYGNGAAMRIAPIGLFYYDELIKLRKIAYRSSQITHNHLEAMEGAALQAYAVALATKIEPPGLNKYDFLKQLIDFTKVDVYKRKLEIMKELLEKKADESEVIQALGNGIEAKNSVPIAIYSFLSNFGFKLALNYALKVSEEGDQDTISAMTGAIAGACYGIEDIPKEWREKLENKDYIEQLAVKLWKIKEK